MKIALLIADGGDGSNSIRFFKDVELANRVVDIDEEFYSNEGSATVIEVGEDFKPPYGWDDDSYTGEEYQ